MIEKVNNDIENINNNIEILPKNNKKNLEKCAEYIDECISKYKGTMEEILKEVDNRVKNIEAKYKNLTYELKQDDIKYNSIKLSDKRVRSSEKLNLEFLFYNLDNTTGSLDEINRVLSLIISNFKGAGIPLKEEDFNITENVNLYIHTLLKEKNDIQDVFNNIFFKSPDILKQIELNVKYIYYQNEKFLDITRIGKFLIFHLTNNKVLISHLRMEGKYIELLENEDNTKYARVVFHLDNNHKLCYDDSRSFGRMLMSDESSFRNEKEIAKLGPEPFDVTNVDQIVKQTKRVSLPIKTALLSQEIITGLGNIYVDEVLFASKIHPLTPAKLISKKEWEAITR